MFLYGADAFTSEFRGIVVDDDERYCHLLDGGNAGVFMFARQKYIKRNKIFVFPGIKKEMEENQERKTCKKSPNERIIGRWMGLFLIR